MDNLTTQDIEVELALVFSETRIAPSCKSEPIRLSTVQYDTLSKIVDAVQKSLDNCLVQDDEEYIEIDSFHVEIDDSFTPAYVIRPICKISEKLSDKTEKELNDMIGEFNYKKLTSGTKDESDLFLLTELISSFAKYVEVKNNFLLSLGNTGYLKDNVHTSTKKLLDLSNNFEDTFLRNFIK